MPGALNDQMNAQIATLSGLTPAQLKERWRELYKREPPRRIGRSLLMRAIAYRVQERALGGLKPATRRLLKRIAEKPRAEFPLKPARARVASVGTVLLREWRGIEHEVSVLERGVIYREQRYRSLSAVARVITGCRWSGPLFFGLRSRSNRESDDAEC
ncbi:MAG: DUF2924 domain-containing protein [Sphingomicrobium sp.]